MGGSAYTGSRPGYVYTTRHGVTDYYPDAARPSLLTRLASWRGTGPEAVVAEPVGEEDEVAALRQRIAKMQAQLAEEEAAEAREKEASERRAAEELAAATRAREDARRAQELQKAAQRRAREAEAAREARAAEAKTKTVLLVGLAGAGKTTALHQLKLGEVVTHHVLEVVELTGWNFTACDLGHPFNDLLRHNNVGDVRGLVFVVDSTDADRLQQARDELHRLCKDKRLREAVLLVFANKQDVPTALYPRELEEKLGLNGRKFFGRPWHVQACCATNGDGLCEGLEWLQREEAARRRAAEEKARLEAEQRALEEEHARERRELAEKQRALAAEHAAEKKALAAKKAEAEARAREVEAEARRAREAAEAKAREEADGTYAAGPFLDGTYVKGDLRQLREAEGALLLRVEAALEGTARFGGRDGALLAELQALRVGEEFALERADVARKIRERLVERGPADLRVELGALRAWRRALVGEPDVEESPAAPTEAPPSDGISEAAGKRLMLAIYMGTIAGVLQILALCTRGHWSKTDYDLGESTAGALFGSWVPAVMTVSLDLWRGYIEFDVDCGTLDKPCRDASDAASTTYEIKAHCGDDAAQAASCQRIYDASVQARAMAFFAGLVAFAAAYELDYIVSKRRLGGIVGSCTASWRRQTALVGCALFVSGAAAVSGAGAYGALLEIATSRWDDGPWATVATPCASGCVQSYGGGMLAMVAGTLVALTAAPLRGRMRWLGVCLPDPYLFLLFMLCVLGFVFITAVKAWWNGLLNA